MAGAVLIGGFLGLGYGIKWLTHVPLPPNVIGLVLLFLALKSGLVKLAWVEKASHFLLRHMMLFFIPSVVGAAFVASVLAGQWFAVAIALPVSAILSLLVAGFTANRLLPPPDASVLAAGAEFRESTEDVGNTP